MIINISKQDTRTQGHKDTRTQGHKDTRTQGHKDTRTQDPIFSKKKLKCFFHQDTISNLKQNDNNPKDDETS